LPKIYYKEKTIIVTTLFSNPAYITLIHPHIIYTRARAYTRVRAHIHTHTHTHTHTEYVRITDIFIYGFFYWRNKLIFFVTSSNDNYNVAFKKKLNILILQYYSFDTQVTYFKKTIFIFESYQESCL